MPRFTGFTNEDRKAIRETVKYGMRVFINSHLGEQTPLEDMHSAFLAIRVQMCMGCSAQVAASNCYSDFTRYEDM